MVSILLESYCNYGGYEDLSSYYDVSILLESYCNEYGHVERFIEAHKFQFS